ncbi:FAS-associated factor 2 [Amyelois transitella]|uniref:FAS-associated factor 2 n=1 Tax=Amyelois transitella TaxID=680683 RepID=UPI00067E0FCD|nr:FAS-associated factor 2 [Amyelois transitella]
MDLEDNAMGLTHEQTDKILQFQDLTGIEDMSICRDVLQRHQWDLEVAIQEQLNIREGRPSVFATEARAPPVVHDHIAQQVFTDDAPEGPGGVRGLFRYVVNLVVSMCYNTITSVLNLLLSFVRNDDRRLVTDPLGDVMGFINSYTARYNPHPVFYQGTYAQALNDAKNELRFLIVYLHSDAAQETQNFCRSTLADPEVIQYINTHALFWGCSIDNAEGWRVAQSVGGRRYPLLCVVCVRDHRMTVVARSEGPCSAVQLLQRLRRVVSDNEAHLSAARAARVEREVTARLRAAQDEAYAESLAADQEKERRRAADRAAREERENEDLRRRQQQERQKQELVEARAAMAVRLPPEPAPGRGTVALLIRLPGGERLTRRFTLCHTTQDLYDFVFSHPQSPEEFEITTNFPKRVLTRGPYNLSEVGLKDRDVLFVNDVNA